jgi:putative transposase
MSEKRKTIEGKLYYVTLTIVGWIDIFSRKEYVDEVVNNIKFCQDKKGLELYAYVIMTNHIHMIARRKDGTLGALLRDFKSYTSKQLFEMVEMNQQESRKEWMLYMFKFFGKKNNQDFQIWQNTNHPIELYSPHIIRQKINYIHNNPVKCGMVASPDHYLYSSANEFSEIKVLQV